MRRLAAVLVALTLPVTLVVSPASAETFQAPVRSPFTDVSTSHVFYEPMAWLADRRISTGYANGNGSTRFEPSAPVLREQMAAFLYRLEGEPAFVPPVRSPFSDVPTSHVFYKQMAWLAGRKISTGYANGNGTTRFEPSAPVLREQMAAFLHRLEGQPPVSAPARSPFTDVPTSHVFYRPMAWLAARKVSTGYANGNGTTRFEPSAEVLREQMAAFLYRLEGVSTPPPPPPGPAAALNVSGTISADTTWGPDAAAVHRITGDVVVAAGATLTLRAGTVVKLDQGRKLHVLGNLRVDGTASSAVTLTSVRDDFGGDTNGDGTSSSPAAGDYVGVSVQSHGTVSMTHARMTYADTAIGATGYTSASPTVAVSSTAISRSTSCVVARGPVHGSFSGSLRDCATGVSADHAFDARHVDWGSPSGPYPFGTGAPVVGDTVAVLPWASFTAPPRHALAAPQAPPTQVQCRDVVLVGVRGSGELPATSDPMVPAQFVADEHGFGAFNYAVALELREQLTAIRPSTTVKLLAVQYLALQIPTSDATVNYDEFVGSVFDGIDKLEQLIGSEAARCPDTRFVLIGSSQGALVIQMALGPDDPPDWWASIAGVVLLANPSRVAGSPETLWEGPGVPAADGVRDVSGSWTGFYPGIDRPIPSWAAPRTISLCHQGDVFCAFRPGARVGPHLSYSAEEVDALAAWQAPRVIELLPAP